MNLRRVFSRFFVSSAVAMLAFSTPTHAQTVTINGNACATGAVTFTGGNINITATGTCVTTVTAAPTISSVSPNPAVAGTSVTISGANFSGASVTIGGSSATVTGNTGSTITATVPATLPAGSATVAVTTAGGTATIALAVQAASTTPPAVATVSPTSGLVGSTITISGTDLAGATVRFGGPTGPVATVSNNTSTTITAIVPNVLGQVTLDVSTAAGSALSPPSFTVTAPPSPTINVGGISPASGPVGTSFTIAGTNFIPGSTTVTVGGANATVSTSSTTSLTVTVPPVATGAQSVVVSVTSAAATASGTFTVTAGTTGADTSLDDGAIPDPSKRPNIIPAQRAGKLNGAGSDMNAYAVETTSCANSNAQLSGAAAVTRRWQHNIDFSAYQVNSPVEYVTMQPGQAFTYKFVTPTTGWRFIQFQEATLATFVPTFMSISTSPCDFDTTKVVTGPNRDYCYSTAGTGNQVNYQITSGAATLGYCKLLPNTKYYLNLRFLDARPTGGNLSTDSCAAVAGQFGSCGGVLQIQ